MDRISSGHYGDQRNGEPPSVVQPSVVQHWATGQCVLPEGLGEALNQSLGEREKPDVDDSPHAEGYVSHVISLDHMNGFPIDGQIIHSFHRRHDIEANQAACGLKSLAIQYDNRLDKLQVILQFQGADHGQNDHGTSLPTMLSGFNAEALLGAMDLEERPEMSVDKRPKPHEGYGFRPSGAVVPDEDMIVDSVRYNYCETDPADIIASLAGLGVIQPEAARQLCEHSADVKRKRVELAQSPGQAARQLKPLHDAHILPYQAQRLEV